MIIVSFYALIPDGMSQWRDRASHFKRLLLIAETPDLEKQFLTLLNELEQLRKENEN